MKAASVPMEDDSVLFEAATTCASKESVSVRSTQRRRPNPEHSVVSYPSVLLCSWGTWVVRALGLVIYIQRACTERLTRAFIVGQQSIDTAGDRAWKAEYYLTGPIRQPWPLAHHHRAEIDQRNCAARLLTLKWSVSGLWPVHHYRAEIDQRNCAARLLTLIWSVSGRWPAHHCRAEIDQRNCAARLLTLKWSVSGLWHAHHHRAEIA